jgi:hypothetical protein
MIEHTDFRDADVASMGEVLMQTRERLERAEARLRRYDSGITAYEWLLEDRPAQYSATITPSDVRRMLLALTAWGETGRKIEALEKALEDIS